MVRRFPDTSEPYDHELNSMAKKIASELKIKVQSGVFVAVQGPI